MFGAPNSKTVAASGPAPATDPQFNYVTALFNGDGTNGAQNNTFLDSSSNAFTITRNGTPTQGSVAPFGPNWSNYFNGTTDYLNTPSNTALTIGTASATVEFWLYPTSISGYQRIITATIGGFAAGAFLIRFNNGLFLAGDSGGNNVNTSTLPELNKWNHIAWVGTSGTTQTLYINGINVGTASTYNLTTAIQWVGGYYSSGGEFTQGYLSNVRIVKGTAVYTSNFTPPTAPLTAVSGTSLLTCQSTYFKDNSANNFALSVSGTPSVQRFSPFLNTASYSPSVYGGGMYFNGSTDYLTAPTSSGALDFTGDFTTEMWIYWASMPTTGYENIYGNNGASGTYLLAATSASTTWAPPYVFNLLVSGVGAQLIGNTVLVANQWYHLAHTRSSGLNRLFVNGVMQTNTYSDSTSRSFGASGAFIAKSSNAYVSNFRYVKGTAVYTANFTPPTAPLTNITNTSLLLSGTNAGVYDSAMTTMVTTVSSAKIDTTEKKYGTGSLSTVSANTTSRFRVPNSPVYAFGTGDWTIECWVWTQLGGRAILDTRSSTSSTTGVNVFVNSTGAISVSVNGTNYNFGGSVPANQWTYVTVQGSLLGGRISVWVNGVVAGSSFISYNFTDPCLTFGGLVTGSGFDGYIDDLRITKGVARYATSVNFTPPTQSLPTQ